MEHDLGDWRIYVDFANFWPISCAGLLIIFTTVLTPFAWDFSLAFATSWLKGHGLTLEIIYRSYWNTMASTNSGVYQKKMSTRLHRWPWSSKSSSFIGAHIVTRSVLNDHLKVKRLKHGCKSLTILAISYLKINHHDSQSWGWGRGGGNLSICKLGTFFI